MRVTLTKLAPDEAKRRHFEWHLLEEYDNGITSGSPGFDIPDVLGKVAEFMGLSEDWTIAVVPVSRLRP